MKEMHLSSLCVPILPLEYQEAGGERLALPLGSPAMAAEPPQPVVVGVPEEEVEQRVRTARDAAAAEANRRVQLERERIQQGAEEQVAKVVREFAEERVEYFRKVEGEVV